MAVSRARSLLGMIDEAFLQHYGVKGMKWGVHHDTPEAKTAKLESAFSKANAKDMLNRKTDKVKQNKLVDLQSSSDHKSASFVRTKAKVSGVNTLSNHDLQVVIARMNLERQFKDLKQIEHEESLVGAGKKWATTFANDVAKDVASSWLKNPRAASREATPMRGRVHVISGVNQRAIGS